MKAKMTIGFLAALSAPAAARAEDATGTVAGRVTYHAGAVKAAALKATKDVAVCGKKPIPDETLLTGADGGLANVVITVDGVRGSTAPPPATARVDQKDCRYVPHVQAAPVGTTLQLVNSDPLLHNAHGYVGDQTAFNLAMPIQNQRLSRKLDQTGVVALKCDAGHTWMSAYVVVTPDALFAVTGADGRFRIPGVPPGSYRVTLWHEKLGQRSAQATVAAGGDARVDVAW